MCISLADPAGAPGAPGLTASDVWFLCPKLELLEIGVCYPVQDILVKKLRLQTNLFYSLKLHLNCVRFTSESTKMRPFYIKKY